MSYVLEVSEDDNEVAYLYIKERENSEVAKFKETISLRDLLGNYNGPDLYLDFDVNRNLIGVEILG